MAAKLFNTGSRDAWWFSSSGDPAPLYACMPLVCPTVRVLLYVESTEALSKSSRHFTFTLCINGVERKIET